MDCSDKRPIPDAPVRYEFEAEICKVEGVDGAYIVFPHDLRAVFGKGRVAVTAVFDGLVVYEGSLVYRKTPFPILGVRKDIREKLHKQPGDRVQVVLWERRG